jgi:anti-anti-sigma regulatory factor
MASPTNAVFRFTSPDVLEAPATCGLVAVPDLVTRVARWTVEHDRNGPRVLVLDLSGVEMWEMTVLRPLVWARRRCVQAGADAVLRLPTRPLFSPGEVAVLEQLFAIVDAPDGAGHRRGAPSPGVRR